MIDTFQWGMHEPTDSQIVKASNAEESVESTVCQISGAGNKDFRLNRGFIQPITLMPENGAHNIQRDQFESSGSFITSLIITRVTLFPREICIPLFRPSFIPR